MTTTGITKAPPEPGIRQAWLPLVAVLSSLLITLAAITFTGAADSRQLQDPGAIVRYGAPLIATLNDIAAAVAMSALVFVAGVLGFPGSTSKYSVGDWLPAWNRCLTIAGIAAIVWVFAGLAQLIFFVSNASGLQVSDSNFGAAFAEVLDTDIAKSQLVSVVVAAIVATLAIGCRTLGMLGLATALSVIGVLPKSLTGHAAGSGDHETAVTAMGLHLVGASLWLGGIFVIFLLARQIRNPQQLRDVMMRFSTLAMVAFAFVATSGLVAAWIRIGTPEDLATRWGALIIAKSIALVLLGAAGAWHRLRLLKKITTDAATRATFWRLLAAEAVLLLFATGLAGALAATAAPTPAEVLRPLITPAEVLTGYPLPPPLDGTTFFSVWRFDVFGLTLAVVLAVAYGASVRKLAIRGDKWPIVRTVNWFVGIALLVFAINGSPGVYGRVLFSSHMVEHMMLSMLIPLFLTGGAPVTLWLRALAPRRDGSRGAREWLLWLIDSRYGHFITHPIVAAVLFAGGLIVFYYSDIFRFAMNNHVGHIIMVVHFLLVGYVFCNSIVGIDPSHNRFAYPIRIVMLLATMGFHAFFGVTLMSSQELLAAEWFGATGRDWGVSAIADQQEGGQIAWGVGEVPTLALALLVARQWFATDSREAKRRDRKVDRDGDLELEAYNAMLAQRQQH